MIYLLAARIWPTADEIHMFWAIIIIYLLAAFAIFLFIALIREH